MWQFLVSLFGLEDTSSFSSSLHPTFVSTAKTFYPNAPSLWTPTTLRDGKVHYLLASDTDEMRPLVKERLVHLSTMCDRVWHILETKYPKRKETVNLRRCLAPTDGISRIAQKPVGGYDVRAYAHNEWIFIELPTFASVETGADGININESQRRKTLTDIILHELAHVAGYWDHDASHTKTVDWLKSILATKT